MPVQAVDALPVDLVPKNDPMPVPLCWASLLDHPVGNCVDRGAHRTTKVEAIMESSPPRTELRSLGNVGIHRVTHLPIAAGGARRVCPTSTRVRLNALSCVDRGGSADDAAEHGRGHDIDDGEHEEGLGNQKGRDDGVDDAATPPLLGLVIWGIQRAREQRECDLADTSG